ncbi:MAG TPA: hypothetical protein VLA76_01165 [Candidatus Angelobacter sp.]|nr:hypothetical protein [Candidatus Angelobacter sp.]
MRFLTDAFSVGGMARGVSHGGHGSAPPDQLAARAAAQEHLRRRPDDAEPDEEPERLIDRIPGAVLLLFVAVLVVTIYLVGR